jgi:hypothetical protein
VALTSAGARERVSDGVREEARTRKVATKARVGFGRDRGIAVGNEAEPGSTPWAAASPTSAVGSRKRVRVRLGQGVPEAVKGAVPPPLRCYHERDLTGHGEAAAVRIVLNAAASPTREEKGGPRSSLAPRIDTRACWGARWREASGPRGYARERECEREREHERLGAAPRTQGDARPRERARVDEGSGTCKRVIPAWHEGRHHQRWHGGAERLRVLPRLEGRGIHMGR